jgi:hypothetical protein
MKKDNSNAPKAPNQDYNQSDHQYDGDILCFSFHALALIDTGFLVDKGSHHQPVEIILA